jgi:hypothetical protein
MLYISNTRKLLSGSMKNGNFFLQHKHVEKQTTNCQSVIEV